MPVVLRISVGSKYGAQHSQDWTALVHHIPGLKVVYPVTPYDAKGMMNAALAGTDPVIFFESQKVYDTGEMFAEPACPKAITKSSWASPRSSAPGTDLTIITLGPALYTAVAAADELQARFGPVEVDRPARRRPARTTSRSSSRSRKTGKVLLVMRRGRARHA